MEGQNIIRYENTNTTVIEPIPLRFILEVDRDHNSMRQRQYERWWPKQGYFEDGETGNQFNDEE